MSTTGTVQITINDNGGASAIQVPAPSVVAIFGVSSAGTANIPISTRSASTLISSFGYGPLVELGALLIAQGATVIATKCAQNLPGTASTVTGESGTSACTTTLDGTVGAFDMYFVQVNIIQGCTVGAVGAQMKIQVSLDAGRNFGPVQVINAATAPTTFTIPNTGITLSFSAGDVMAGDSYKFSTKEPQTTTGNVATAIAALGASAFATSGWGSMIIHGAAVSGAGAFTSANINTIATSLDTLATGQQFERAFVNLRDAIYPYAWVGAGTGETDAVYTASLASDAAVRNSRRMSACGGYYNMPSAIANSVAGTPSYRRPCSWAIQARKSTVGVQVLSSRVKDGPLTQIVVDSSSDPSDGFVYHDERVNPGMNDAGIATLWTRLQQGQGFFVRSENLFSPIGSEFDLFAIGQCFDNFCTTLVRYFTAQIDGSVRTNTNGTIYENDAQALESGASATVAAAMPGQYQPENTTIVIDRTYNVMSNKKARVTGVFGQLGYIREFDLTVQLQNPLSA